MDVARPAAGLLLVGESHGRTVLFATHTHVAKTRGDPLVRGGRRGELLAFLTIEYGRRVVASFNKGAGLPPPAAASFDHGATAECSFLSGLLFSHATRVDIRRNHMQVETSLCIVV